MRLRPVLALSALLVFLPSLGHALGLGEIELKSGLNQPMQAQIELLQIRDLNPNEIIPNLAGPKDFERAGVSREFFLTDMRFEVKTLEDGRLVVDVKTRRPVREPFMNFLVEVIWPGGRLLREYTLLIDPPIYADRVADRPAPSVSLNRQTQPKIQQVERSVEPTITKESDVPPIQSIAGQPINQPAAGGTESTAQRNSPEPVLNNSLEEMFAEGAPEERQQESEPTRSNTDPGTYTTEKGDVLWNIATMLKPSDATVQQTMLAIQAKNPDAFINGNINLMKRGQVLRMPSQEEVKALSRQEAVAQVALQEKAWRQRLNDRSGRGEEQVAKETISDRKVNKQSTPESSPTGVLTLSNTVDSGGGTESVSSQDSSAQGSEGGGSGGSIPVAELQNEMDRITRERSEAQSRLADLESMLADNERLIALQNQNIAVLREQLAEIERKAALAASAQTGIEAQMPGETDPDGMDLLNTPEGDNGNLPEETSGASSGAVDPNEYPELKTYNEDTFGSGTEQSPETGSTNNTTTQETAAGSQPPAKPFYLNPIYIGIAVGAVIVAGILFFVVRRGRDDFDDDFEDDLELEQGLDGSLKLDGEVSLDELSEDEARDVGSSYQLDDQIGNQSEILEDADLQMAYGFYAEAQKKLKSAISHDPSCLEYYWKLLEVYVETHDAQGFIACEAALGSASPQALQDGKLAQLRANFGDDLPPYSPDAAAGFLDASAGDMGGSQPVAEMSHDAPAAAGAPDDLSGLESLAALESGLTSDLGSSDLSASASPELSNELSLDEMSSTESLMSAVDSFDAPSADSTSQDDLASDMDLGADLDLGALESDLSLDLSVDSASETPSDALSGQVETDLELPSEPSGLDLGDDEVAQLNASTQEEPAPQEDFDPAALMAELDDVFEPSQQLSGDLDSPILGSAPLVDDQPETTPEASQDDYLNDLSQGLDINLDTDTQSGTDLSNPDLSPADLSTAEFEEPSTPEMNDSDLGDLGDDDDLMGDDDMTIKLDLARAYIDMGDKVGARDILDEVVSEGTAEQQQEAHDLLKRVS